MIDFFWDVVHAEPTTAEYWYSVIVFSISWQLLKGAIFFLDILTMWVTPYAKRWMRKP